MVEKNVKYYFHYVAKQLTCFGKICDLILSVIYNKKILFFRLASLGHEIVGIEGAQIAVEEFFKENNLEYTVRVVKDFQVYEV
jgi:hypothetical protein